MCISLSDKVEVVTSPLLSNDGAKRLEVFANYRKVRLLEKDRFTRSLRNKKAGRQRCLM